MINIEKLENEGHEEETPEQRKISEELKKIAANAENEEIPQEIKKRIEKEQAENEFREKALGFGLYKNATEEQINKTLEWYKNLSDEDRQRVDADREESRRRAALGLGLNENATQEEINKYYDWYQGLTDEERQDIDDRNETVVQAMKNKGEVKVLEQEPVIVREKDKKSKLEEWQNQSAKIERMSTDIEKDYGEEPLSPLQSLLVEKIRKESESRGIDVDTASGQVGTIVIDQINMDFTERYGFSFSAEDLPRVIVDSKNEANAKGRTMYARKGMDRDTGEVVEANIIAARDLEDIVRGSSMSEELAHFYREHLRPESDKVTDELITEEFFGFLGRRLFEQSVKDHSSLAMYEDNQRKVMPKKQALKLTGALRKNAELMEDIVGDWKQSMSENDPNIIKAERVIQMVRDRRSEALIHQRGYEWALKVDLSKIKKWEKLFSMPNQEVRKRFFTDDPDYEGL
ncbi:MAG: hypothetical protein A3D44_03800 [Candidatus Staskawiczbacteria bacterium RIFCSPHIGHO2_02_FULL_42_22]|uniref:Uncharacterized protein n=1 Tax=Candidatus Staskawiczbacteria bacterium RIFCSPHIGHO2_02_FULL_42_22 TaxID=1802207 RepID=A0A1G2I3W9_9BACT|nr:MAG: hypothetical protein A3D44_03800 [Candidatus Staskawiczbacteria bacterium RIFCSPHIGHO2_02_FULL_42_22]